MEENSPWKAVYWGVIFSLVLLGIIYFFISPRDSTYFQTIKEEKAAEFNQTRIAGRKDQKRSWEFNAEKGWVSKDQEISYLTNVKNGVIYKNDKPIIQKLFAPLAKVFRRSEIIEAYTEKPENSNFHSMINLGRITNDSKSEWAKISANSLKYFPQNKRSELDGKVKLIKNDSSFFAPRIEVDHEKRSAFMPQRTLLTRDDLRVEANSMEYFSDQEKIIANGDIKMIIRKGKNKTIISCQHCEFNTEMKEDIILSGSIEAIQGAKAAVGDEGIYSNAKKELYLKGRVKAVFEKAQVFLKDQTLQKLKNNEAQSLLKTKTFITCKNLIFSNSNSDAKAWDTVFITQKGKEAKAQEAFYSDNEETITMNGNVYLKKEGKWVSAQQIIVSVVNETFEAIGSVEAEFKI